MVQVIFQNKEDLLDIVHNDERLSKAMDDMGYCLSAGFTMEKIAEYKGAVRKYFSDSAKCDVFRDMCDKAYDNLNRSEYWRSIYHPKDGGFDVAKIYLALPDKRGGRCFHDVGHDEDVVSLSPLSFAIDFFQCGLDKSADQEAYIKAVLAHEFTHADQYNRNGVEAPADYLPGEGESEKGDEPSWFEEGLHESECRATAMAIVVKDGDSEKVQKAVAQKQCLYREDIVKEDLPKDYKDAFSHIFAVWDGVATSPKQQSDNNYVLSEMAACKMASQFREYNHNYDGQRISTQDLAKIVARAKNVSKALDMARKHIIELSRGHKENNPIVSNKQNVNSGVRTISPQQNRR